MSRRSLPSCSRQRRSDAGRHAMLLNPGNRARVGNSPGRGHPVQPASSPTCIAGKPRGRIGPLCEGEARADHRCVHRGVSVAEARGTSAPRERGDRQDHQIRRGRERLRFQEPLRAQASGRSLQEIDQQPAQGLRLLLLHPVPGAVDQVRALVLRRQRSSRAARARRGSDRRPSRSCRR